MAQLECRIVVLYGRRIEVGMYDPISFRYERIGYHSESELDKVIRDLKTSMERAGHRVSFCERYV
jgi:hypothetical protein